MVTNLVLDTLVSRLVGEVGLLHTQVLCPQFNTYTDTDWSWEGTAFLNGGREDGMRWFVSA